MKTSLAIIFAIVITSVAAFAVDNGAAAPDFTLKTADGTEVSLSDFRGKTVVLEWVNPYCPFVKKFYSVGAMQKFQEQAKADGAVWLSINSTKTGHAEFLDDAKTKAYIDENKVASTWLIDGSGDVGRAYDAARTPHMFIINGEGVVVYQGAIDSIRDASPESIEKADNYVLTALKAIADGSEIENAETRPYGCTVKY